MNKIFKTNTDNFDNFISELKNNEEIKRIFSNIRTILSNPLKSVMSFNFNFKGKTFEIMITKDESNLKIFVFLKRRFNIKLFKNDYDINTKMKQNK